VLWISKRKAEDFYKLAMTSLKAGDLDEALRNLRQAVNLDGNNVKYRKSLLDIYVKLGLCEEAVKEAQKLTELAPDDPEIHYKFALCLHKMGKGRSPKRGGRRL
jgi:Putative Zn-dependent protease, contains TPR repeats